MTTYPDRCTLQLERRTIPGERPGRRGGRGARRCDRVRARRSTFEADVALVFAQDPSDVPVDAPIVARSTRRCAAPASRWASRG
jgi:acetylornithine deacetylase